MARIGRHSVRSAWRLAAASVEQSSGSWAKETATNRLQRVSTCAYVYDMCVDVCIDMHHVLGMCHGATGVLRVECLNQYRHVFTNGIGWAVGDALYLFYIWNESAAAPLTDECED